MNGQPVVPTSANLKFAHRVAGEIERKIKPGLFTPDEFFPDSPRAKCAAGLPTTFGQVAADWHAAKGQLTAATRDQYATSVRLWERLLGKAAPMDDITYQTLAKTVGGHPWAVDFEHGYVDYHYRLNEFRVRPFRRFIY